MDLIRLSRTDLEDLRNLLLYLKENGMKIDDVNDMIYYLGKKYEFDPFKCEINLLTGIISNRDNHYDSFEQLPTKIVTKQPVAEQIPIKVAPTPKQEVSTPSTVVEKLDNGKKLYRLNQNIKPLKKELTTEDYIKEFSHWIKKNQLDLMTVRKMISMIEQYKRLEEVSPDEFHEKPEEIIELTEWVESRGLDYLKLRMMLAVVAQKEANLNREMVIAR